MGYMGGRPLYDDNLDHLAPFLNLHSEFPNKVSQTLPDRTPSMPLNEMYMYIT